MREPTCTPLSYLVPTHHCVFVTCTPLRNFLDLCTTALFATCTPLREGSLLLVVGSGVRSFTHCDKLYVYPTIELEAQHHSMVQFRWLDYRAGIAEARCPCSNVVNVITVNIGRLLDHEIHGPMKRYATRTCKCALNSCGCWNTIRGKLWYHACSAWCFDWPE